MRFLAALLIVVLLALLAGCGDSSEETTSSTPAPRNESETQGVRLAWERNPKCKPPQGASRWGCSVGSFRCQGVVTDRGWSISCSRPGRSLGFTVPRD
jgi:hypothetical protein